MQHQTKKILSAAVTTTVVSGVFATSYAIAYKLTHPKRSPISATPDQAQLIYEDITVTTSDQLVIRGWFLPAQQASQITPSQQTIIFAHHYGGARSSDELGSLLFFEQFLTKGYNVIAFDFRNSGLSDGDQTTMGVNEQTDLHAIIDWCNAKIPDGTLVLWGFSMGAAVAINLGWQIDNVVGVIADSSFTDLSTYCLEAFDAWVPFTPTVLSYPVFAVSRYVFGIETTKMSPIQAIAKYQKPVLLIHAHKDALIPVKHATDLYIAADPTYCELCILPSTAHAQAYFTNQNRYLTQVFALLARSFAMTSAKKA